MDVKLMTQLHYLVNNESLNLPSSTNATCTSPSSNENLLDLVKKIRNKRTSLNTQSRTTISQAKERTCKINIGWMAFHNNRYTQVRAMSGGGTRTVDFPLTADYNSIMEKAKELFFPNAFSTKDLGLYCCATDKSRYFQERHVGEFFPLLG
ncbi:uncharacterized protein [Argopecten irradians]|uniref:uncharacterized protein n=1 Tax=Argopecten irradians TaxID=31199 RepID=UPI00371460F2